jgi:hypothetical protein
LDLDKNAITGLSRAGLAGKETVMDGNIKTGPEFVDKIENFKNQSKTTILDRTGETCASRTSGGELPDRDWFFELEEMPEKHRVAYDSVESSELKTGVSNEIKIAGGFKIQRDIWGSAFGKLIQALPIPALLIDEELNVAILNQSCAKFTPAYEQIRGRSFLSFFATLEAAETAASIVNRVFSDRKPRAGEGSLKIEDAILWARMTFRSVKISHARFVLVLVEALTREKIRLCENEMLRRELDKRVEQRTAQLIKINDDLRQEVAELKRAELKQVKTLRGLLPICASCKKIQDDRGHWVQVEVYVRDHTEADFTHSICPECTKKLYPDTFSTIG